jgi:DNA repair exonuclease SbcCD ATPase subunit
VAAIDETLKRLERVQQTTTDEKAKPELARILKELRDFLQTQEDERNRLLEQIRASEARIAELQAAIARLEEENAAQAKEIEELKKRVPPERPPPAASPLDVATAFKQVVEQVQSEARETPGVGTTIKSLDLEVKAFVQVEEGNVTTLAFPQPDVEVDPQALSTLRLSFGAIPVATTPPEGEPRRATTRRRRRRT